MKQFIFILIIFIQQINSATSVHILTKKEKTKRQNVKRKKLYDEQLASRLWRLCILSYCSEDKKNKIISQFSYAPLKIEFNNRKEFTDLQPENDIRVFSKDYLTDLGFAIYDYQKDIIYIVFRGIRAWQFEDIEKLIYNEFIEIQNFKVNFGFYQSIQQLSAQMVLAIQELKNAYPTAKLIFTGHSIGGSLAILGAVDLVNKTNMSLDSIYTFGAPKVGDEAFNQYFMKYVIKNGSYYRVTHKIDLVPLLPPESQTDFQQSYPEVYYDFDQYEGGYKICERRNDIVCKSQSQITPNLFHHFKFYGKSMMQDIISCGLYVENKKFSQKFRFLQ